MFAERNEIIKKQLNNRIVSSFDGKPSILTGIRKYYITKSIPQAIC